VERTHCNREVERVGRGWKISRLSCAAITENALKSLLWRQSLETVLIAGWATKKLKIVPFSPDGKDFGFIRGKWVHDAVF